MARKTRSRGETRFQGATLATTDHEKIRQWVQEREGSPAVVEGTGGEDDPGILGIDFPGYGREDTLRHIDWVAWFRKFDREELALVYREETSDGERSNFNKLVSRETIRDRL